MQLSIGLLSFRLIRQIENSYFGSERCCVPALDCGFSLSRFWHYEHCRSDPGSLHLEKPLIIIAVLLINMVASSVVSYSAEGQFVCACFSEGTVNEENRWYTPPKCKEEMKQMAIFARNLPGITVFFFFFLRVIT